MAAPFFYLSDGTNTLSLDDNVSELELGGIKRNFNFEKFTGSHGGVITGNGDLGERKFSISRKERAQTGDYTAWNTRRQTYLNWFLKNKNKNIYLYVRNALDTFAVRTQIYCTSIGADKYKNVRLSSDRDVQLISPSGIFEKTTITDSSTYSALTGNSAIVLTADLSGMLETPLIWTITPNAALTIIRIWISESVGFSLLGTFASGTVIVYDHYANTLKIGSSYYDVNNYLVSGGRFVMPLDEDEINYYFDASVDLKFSYYERYI